MSEKFETIYLIGPMGSGKTTVGRQLAHLLNYPFYDIDQIIIKNSGVDISWIFEQEGEQGFRKRETTALQTLNKQQPAVIATGGGCVITPENRTLLKNTGVVIYLKVSTEQQLLRIGHTEKARPLFAKNATPEKLKALNQARDPYYQEVATYTIVTDFTSPEKIAQMIFTELKKHQKGS